MVHQETSGRKKGKPRGRPFPPNNNKGKPKHEVLALTRHESSDERGSIAPAPQSAFVEPENANKSVLHELPKLVMNITDEILRGNMEATTKQEEPKKPEAIDQIVDRLEFQNGSNKVEIRFIRLSNRMYRIQVFLNDETEIRPVTYTGISPGTAYWNLLKKMMKPS